MAGQDGAEVGVADIVGTGGDGKNTLNVSTPASLISAAMGIPVAKHGNRSASANSGSADVAEHLGACLTLSPEQASATMQACGYCFIFAANFHPALKPLGPIRKELGFKTIFNLLGPLLNPCAPRHMVVGVGKKEKVGIVVGALEKKANLRCLVVHSEDGLDKISPAVPTHTWLVESGKETVQATVTPADFGLPESSHTESYFKGGGGPVENAATILRILDGSEAGAASDFACVQAAALAVVCGKAGSYSEGMRLAKEAISSGKARRQVDDFVRHSTLAGRASSTDILSRILKRRAVDLCVSRRVDPIEAVRSRAEAARSALPPISLLDLFPAAGFGFCAELKRASPSEGDISSRDIISLARTYAAAGVQVISVLTEPVWFKGTLADLSAVRETVSDADARPAVLRKDFVISKYQVLEARAAGADTLLLIVAAQEAMAAEGETLEGLIAFSREWGMEPLVEVVSEDEVDAAVAAGARVVGVNNRDLRTFKVDLTRTGTLVAYAAQRHPASDIRWIGLSGVSTSEHVSTMRSQGAQGVLVGTSLMRSDDPSAMLASWKS
eukprot:TRINITY_DN67764_c0_g1_i1.p1 TRINITY_DN67764_c0_g1~~TRINITY_DN67764_c0_g1_i1.p1  ORF type:complete len:632 (+),score=198.03 TRINITY_DN67764_c0_g1_i1:225-1898(+)